MYRKNTFDMNLIGYQPVNVFASKECQAMSGLNFI